MIKGIIFDFDGTIVDSEISRLKSLNLILKKHNINYKITYEAWNLNYRRLRSIEILEDIKKRNNFNYDSKKLYTESHIIREEIEKKGIRIINGFIEFYNFLKKNKIKIIIASGGKREHIEYMLKIEKLPDIEIISREDYENGKPAPDCYLLALKKLNLKKEEVIIFDDSVTGIEAGIEAGCKTIAINSFDKGINDLNIFMKIKDYTELKFKELLQY